MRLEADKTTRGCCLGLPSVPETHVVSGDSAEPHEARRQPPLEDRLHNSASIVSYWGIECSNVGFLDAELPEAQGTVCTGCGSVEGYHGGEGIASGFTNV